MDWLVLRPSKGQWMINSVILGALFLACAFTTVIQGSTNEAFGWIMLVLLGPLSAWSIWFAFSKRTRPELRREGFMFFTPTATGAYRRSDVEIFAHGSMNRHDAVFFKFAPHYNGKKPPLHQLAGALSKGFEMALPDTSGLSAQALAELLTEWRARALEGG
jgi:hypothetical protein